MTSGHRLHPQFADLDLLVAQCFEEAILVDERGVVATQLFVLAVERVILFFQLLFVPDELPVRLRERVDLGSVLIADSDEALEQRSELCSVFI